MVCPSLEHCLVILIFLVNAYKQTTDELTNTPNLEPLQIVSIDGLSLGDLELGNNIEGLVQDSAVQCSAGQCNSSEVQVSVV